MTVRHAVSLWNYSHYPAPSSLEDICSELSDRKLGIELWRTWQDQDLFFDPGTRARAARLTGDLKVSLHTPSTHADFRALADLVDAAHVLNADPIVLHPLDLAPEETQGPDIPLTRDIVAYAAERNVRIALENGGLDFLTKAIDHVDALGVCLDTVHVYTAGGAMAEYLNVLGRRIIHLHISDVLAGLEASLPRAPRGHFIPGTGAVPDDDWGLLAETLKKNRFDGTAVYEIRPRNPLQTAVLAADFFERQLNGQA